MIAASPMHRFNGSLALALSTVLIASAAQAWLIGDSVQKGGPQALCRLLVRDADYTVLSVFSGVLTSRTEIYTSAHALVPLKDKNLQLEIKCGYQGVSEKTLVSQPVGKETLYVAGLEFAESLRAQEIFLNVNYDTSHPEKFDAENDSALIVLANEAKLIPLPLAKPETSPEFECRTSGFGISSDGIGGLPHYVGVRDNLSLEKNTFEFMTVRQLTNTNLIDLKSIVDKYGGDVRRLRLETDLYLAKNKVVLFNTMKGDSGGPLYCRRSTQAEWELFGILSGSGSKIEGTEEGLQVRHRILWTTPDRAALTVKLR